MEVRTSSRYLLDAADTVITVADTSDYAVGDKVTLSEISDSAVDSNDGKTFSITEIPSSTTFKIGLDAFAASAFTEQLASTRTTL